MVVEDVFVGRLGGFAFYLGALAVVLGTLAAIPALVVALITAISAALSKRPHVPILITGFAMIGNLATLLCAGWVVLWLTDA